jgi:hypothetical protein
MRALHEAGFDIAGANYHEKTIDLIVTEKELELVRGMLSKHELQVQVVDKQLAPDSDYYSPAEVTAAISNFAERYPTISRLETIGTTLEGRPIWALKITDNPDARESEEPVVLFNAMHHAREVMTTEIAFDTIDYLLTGYGVNEQVTRWVDRNEIWIVPMVNPDGNHKVWTSDSMWRKNARGNYGVDINRNYPYQWNACGGSSGSRYSQTYRGPSPASEPETNALMSLVARIQPVFNISYHSYSEMVLYPYGCNSQFTINREVVEGIGAQLANLLPSDDNASRRYAHGTPWQLLYSVDGGDTDWMYNQYGVIPYVIEVNSTRLGFQPSYSRWRQPTVEKMRAGWAFLLDRLEGPGIRGQVTAERVLFEEVTIDVRALGTSSTMRDQHIVKADGTYHLVLKPGTYELAFRLGDRDPIVRTVELGDERLQMDIEF